MSTYFEEGKSFYACATPIIVREDDGATYVYGTDGKKLSETDFKFGRIFGGGKDGKWDSTSVTMESGFVAYLCGGSEGGKVVNSSVTLKGGMVGEYLYGAGIDDSVEHVKITISGGAIKRGFYGAGTSLFCGDEELVFEHIVSTKVFTGTKNEEGTQKGDIKMTMKDGIVLNVFVGGNGMSEGDADITVSGGLIEKQFATKNHTGTVNLHLYDTITLYNGMEVPFPIIEEGMNVEYFKSDFKWDFYPYKEHKQDVMTKKGDEGKLVLRFFEMRNPEVPKNTALFSHFIGDCILVNFPNGEVILVDTGMPYAYEGFKEDLATLGITKINYLVLTHPHIDHLGSAPQVIVDYDVDEVVLPHVLPIVPDGGNKNTYLATLETIIDRHTAVRKVWDGEKQSIGECEILYLNPEAPYTPAPDLNAGSVALKITYKDSSVMLGGDITDGVEKRIAEEYGDKIKCDLLKLSHHGITGQTYYDYVDKCSPKYVFAHNLRERGVFMQTTRYALNHVNHIPDERIFVTGTHGTLKAVLDGKGGIEVATQYENI